MVGDSPISAPDVRALSPELASGLPVSSRFCHCWP